MQLLQTLYQQNPFWIWMALGALFVGLDVSVGRGALIWPAVAAAALALVNLAGIRLGAPVEGGAFAIASIASVGLALWLGRTKGTPRPAAGSRVTAPPHQAGLTAPELTSADRSRLLIGRIGRTAGEFANGVGRVSIDGAEWGAELDAGDGHLPPDAQVRVIGVSGGVRLQVRGLSPP